MFNKVFLNKVYRIAMRKGESLIGRFYDLDNVLNQMAARPFELHFEMTNLCNANCVFCPYQFQTRDIEYMSDEVFNKALEDYVAEGGGSVFFTPIVGDALIHEKTIERIKKARSYKEIDRIKMVTNCILADRHGAEEIINSGLTTLTISTAGFEEEMYERVYRSKQYKRVKKNVLDLLEANRKAGSPVHFVLALRPDRPLKEILAQPDFQEIMEYEPELDFTWSFSTVRGLITRETLPQDMKIRKMPRKDEACVQIYNGPIVLPDGRLFACSCIAGIDGPEDLILGNIKDDTVGNLWRSEKLQNIRAGFGTEDICETCEKCDIYRNLELYRTAEGRTRGDINARRSNGEIIYREDDEGIFTGG